MTSQKKEDPLEKKLLSVINDKDYKPLTESELLAHCDISPKQKKEANKIITKLIKEGFIEIKKKKIALPKNKNVLRHARFFVWSDKAKASWVDL